jgi:hypothetical protein
MSHIYQILTENTYIEEYVSMTTVFITNHLSKFDIFNRTNEKDCY